MLTRTITAIVLLVPQFLSLPAATAASSAQQTLPCTEGGTVAVDAYFGPRYAWTLQGIRYSADSQCSMVYQNRSINGRMILKIKMITNGTVVGRETERCTGCSAISFGTGGYDKVKIRAIAYKSGSTQAYDTGWRRLI